MAEKKLFVHTRDESPDMFETKWINYFSRVHWSTPLVVYTPIILFFIYRFVVSELTILPIVGLILGGILFWSIFEYGLHRWVFHHHPKTELGKKIHFLSHGVHHDFPQDSKRLVMPLAISLPLGALALGVSYLTLGPVLMNPFLVGFIAGYVFYDTMHYATHHVNFKNRYFQAIKKHHMKHHYQNPDEGFGFTSKVWDKVFSSDFSGKKPE